MSYIATVLFHDGTGKERQTLVVADNLEQLHIKMERVKKIIAKHNLKFIGSVIETVEEEGPTSLDYITLEDELVH